MNKMNKLNNDILYLSFVKRRSVNFGSHSDGWHKGPIEDIKKFGEKIISMYINSYKHIGIIDMTFEQMRDYYGCCWYYMINNDIKALILFWPSKFGNKLGLMISENNEIGKNISIPKLIELLKIQGYYGEASEIVEYLLRKNGLDNIKNHKLISKIVNVPDKDILKTTLIENHNGKKIIHPIGSYSRYIKHLGQRIKSLYGNPCDNYNIKLCDGYCPLISRL